MHRRGKSLIGKSTPVRRAASVLLDFSNEEQRQSFAAAGGVCGLVSATQRHVDNYYVAFHSWQALQARVHVTAAACNRPVLLQEDRCEDRSGCAAFPPDPSATASLICGAERGAPPRRRPPSSERFSTSVASPRRSRRW